MKKVTAGEISLLLEAWIYLAFARTMLVFMPFRKIAPRLGIMKKERSEDVAQEDNHALQQVKVAILRASRVSPWRTKCFEQSIAASYMLRQRGIHYLLYLGVFKNEQQALKAHSWLRAGTMIVTGGPDVSKYTIVNWFAG